MKYNILSPDNFPISHDWFKTKKAALQYFENWKDSFKQQGYYSQLCYNGYKREIPLDCLADYCEWVKN